MCGKPRLRIVCAIEALIVLNELCIFENITSLPW